MSDQIKGDRRRFVGAAAMTLATAALNGSVVAQPARKMLDTGAFKAGTNTSFQSLKQIDAGLLNIGYAEAGPAGGEPVILLHGWPYDI